MKSMPNFGFRMTSMQRKAAEKEIRKQMAEFDRRNFMELDAIILWILHTAPSTKFGPKRLKEFYDEFNREYRALIERYETDGEDNLYLFTTKLKDYGIDLEEWEKEKSQNASTDAQEAL